MAQHFYGPFQDSTGLFTTPPNTAIYPSTASHTTYPQPQPNVPNIKDEFFTFGVPGQEADPTPSNRPSKRQKTVEGGNNHKFVSQKKWKFSEGQPWLPSKLSSKAQNASKTGKVGKAESASPKLPSLPAVSLPMRSCEESRSQVPLRHTKPPQSSRSTSRGWERTNVRATQPVAAPASPIKRPVTVVSTLNSQSLSAVGTSRPATTEYYVGQGPTSQKGKESNKGPNKPAETPMQGSVRPMLSKSKSSRSIQALSLERDAERIAALKEEKIKENEANMFRERMLRRQQELKKHRGTGQSNQDDDNSVSARVPSEPPSTVQEDPADSDDPHLHSPTNETITTTGIAISGSPTRANRQSVLLRSQNSTTRSGPAVSRFKEQGDAREMGLTANRTSMSPFNRSSTQTDQLSAKDHQDILFGKRGGQQLPADKQPVRSATMSKNFRTPHAPAKGSAPFELEDADIATQLADFTNQLLLKRPAQKSQTSQASSNQISHAQHYQRHALSPMPTTQPQISLRPDSETPPAGFNAMERASSSLASPTTPTYSRAPTSVSTQQFSHMDISAAQSSQSQPAAMMYSSGPIRNRPVSMGSMPNHSAYYGPSQQRWGMSDQQMGHPTMDPAGAAPAQPSGGDFSMSMSGQVNSTSHPQQHRPHSGLMSSDTNMFNGNARANAGGAAGAAPPKQRVNMFSNTKGTPFPMHEVIKQIEMT